MLRRRAQFSAAFSVFCLSFLGGDWVGHFVLGGKKNKYFSVQSPTLKVVVVCSC